MKRKFSLKKNKDISLVFRMKRTVSSQSYVIYLGPLLDNRLRIAISVSKKCGNAVKRNYEKRVLREILRPYLALLKKRDYLIVIRPGVTKLSFLEKKEQIEKMFTKNLILQGDQNE